MAFLGIEDKEFIRGEIPSVKVITSPASPVTGLAVLLIVRVGSTTRTVVVPVTD